MTNLLWPPVKEVPEEMIWGEEYLDRKLSGDFYLFLFFGEGGGEGSWIWRGIRTVKRLAQQARSREWLGGGFFYNDTIACTTNDDDDVFILVLKLFFLLVWHIHLPSSSHRIAHLNKTYENPFLYLRQRSLWQVFFLLPFHVLSSVYYGRARAMKNFFSLPPFVLASSSYRLGLCR